MESLARLLSHHLSRGLPPVTVEIPPEQPVSDQDLKIVERLLAAYDYAIEDEAAVPHRPSADVWEMIRNEFHGELIDALQHHSVNRVAKMMTRAFRENISYGLGCGVMVYRDVLTPRGNSEHAVMALDRLMTLAEALSLLPYENPEQGRWGENVYLEANEIATRIERCLGVPLCPPPVCGYLGIRLISGLLSAISCGHLYAAYRLTQVISANPGVPQQVAEIGGGFGGCAYYSYLLGIPDYRIFDLPLINFLQGYYLLRAAPKACIVLYREPECDRAISIYPYWTLSKQRCRAFGAVLNQDSLPEIAPEIVMGYLREIARTSSYFLSINQEGQAPSRRPDRFQNWVPQLCDQVPELERIGRFPFWLRRGYVEEIYRTRSS